MVLNARHNSLTAWHFVFLWLANESNSSYSERILLQNIKSHRYENMSDLENIEEYLDMKREHL